jgi:hypothetical protein
MAKNVIRRSGSVNTLLLTRWVSFIIGHLVDPRFVSIPLKAIGRVLP